MDAVRCLAGRKDKTGRRCFDIPKAEQN